MLLMSKRRGNFIGGWMVPSRSCNTTGNAYVCIRVMLLFFCMLLYALIAFRRGNDLNYGDSSSSSSSLVDLSLSLSLEQHGNKREEPVFTTVLPVVLVPLSDETEEFSLEGLPVRPPPGHMFSSGDKKVLVVYSGPTHFPDSKLLPTNNPGEHRKELYRLNFEYFLKYGIQCRTQDTLLIVTETVRQHYQPRIHDLHTECQTHGHQVILATRNSTCWDLESVRRVMHDNIVDLNPYDYFVYVNCGVTGPSKAWAALPWTDLFTSKLNDKVKMSGLTMNCDPDTAHIQSMVYALDRQGLQIIRDSDAVFECQEALRTHTAPPGSDYKSEQERSDDLIIGRYEAGMGRILLDKGFGLASIVHPIVVFQSNVSQCILSQTHDDIWLVGRMTKHFGRVPRLDEIVFLKSSRVFPDHLAKEINYTSIVDWQWI